MIDKGGRLDFLGSYAADHVDGGLLARELVRKFVFVFIVFIGKIGDDIGEIISLKLILMMAPLPY